MDIKQCKYNANLYLIVIDSACGLSMYKQYEGWKKLWYFYLRYLVFSLLYLLKSLLFDAIIFFLDMGQFSTFPNDTNPLTYNLKLLSHRDIRWKLIFGPYITNFIFISLDNLILNLILLIVNEIYVSTRAWRLKLGNCKYKIMHVSFDCFIKRRFSTIIMFINNMCNIFYFKLLFN